MSVSRVAAGEHVGAAHAAGDAAPAHAHARRGLLRRRGAVQGRAQVTLRPSRVVLPNDNINTRVLSQLCLAERGQ